MKIQRFGMATFTAMLLSFQLFAQTHKVSVSPSVLDVAKWAGFEYQKHVDLAKSGDFKAVTELLDFSGTVDGVDALDHAVTCLELIPYASDLTFAAALNKAKPKLKSVLLERFQLAQGRSKTESFRSPMATWAPNTWAALNGKPFQPAPSTDPSKMAEQKSKKENLAGQTDKAKGKTPPSEIQSLDQSNKQ
ncbi:MAG: hypothetical protein JNJ57_14185 [Saprospiraceae bacterium]|nr:hypothetical protein [Saprospiraceae bacterium]